MDHKKQHFVPQSYLTSWTDPDTPHHYEPYVWVIDKISHDIYKKAPKNILFENNLYTIYSDDGERDLTLEKLLSFIESNFVTVIDKIHSDNFPLDEFDIFILISFLSAMHARTPHSNKQWIPFYEEILKVMKEWDDLDENGGSQEFNLTVTTVSDKSHTVSIDDIEEILENPIPNLFAQTLRAEIQLLSNLDLVIIQTQTSPGFITSDNPVSLFDPEGYKRPAGSQGPALIYPSIEISMPISPSCLLYLNRKGIAGHLDLSEKPLVEELEIVGNANYRTQISADNVLVTNKNEIRWSWFYK